MKIISEIIEVYADRTIKASPPPPPPPGRDLPLYIDNLTTNYRYTGRYLHSRYISTEITTFRSE